MARADAGLTISQLAERAGVARDTISKAEKGQHSLQANTLAKVARALGTTPSRLYADEEEKYAPKARARPNGERSRETIAEQVHISCAYWERRLEGDISNDEVYALASVSWPYTNMLEDLTRTELRELREHYPDEQDLRPRSILEPARYRWVGVALRAARLRINDYPDDPEARQMYREFVDEFSKIFVEYV